MPSPRKESDSTEHALKEAKPPKSEIKSSGADNTAKKGKPGSPVKLLKKGIDVTVVETEQVKSVEESSARKVPPEKNVCHSVSPAVRSNVEITVAVAPSIEITCISPDKIKEETKQITETPEISKDERKIEIGQPAEIFPSKPGCEEDEKNIPGKHQLESSSVKDDKVPSETKAQKKPELPKMTTNVDLSKTDSVREKIAPNVPVSKIAGISTGKSKDEPKMEIAKVVEKLPLKPECKEPGKDVPEKDKLQSPSVKEVKASSETKAQKKSELPKFATNIDLSKTDAVHEKIAPSVPVSKAADNSAGKTKDEPKEEIKSSDASEKVKRILDVKKGQESETQMETENTISGVRIPETCLETDSIENLPKPLSVGVSDSEQVELPKIKTGEYTQDSPTKPVSSKASDDCTKRSIELERLSSAGERKFSRRRFDGLLNKSNMYLHGGHNETLLRIAKPDFTYVPTSLKQIVAVNQGKFQVSVDISQFDFKNIHLSIQDGKIHVRGRQENETEFGVESHEIQQIFKIPKHVNRDELSACITKDYRLLVEAPIRIPSSNSSK